MYITRKQNTDVHTRRTRAVATVLVLLGVGLCLMVGKLMVDGGIAADATGTSGETPLIQLLAGGLGLLAILVGVVILASTHRRE